MDVRPYRSKSLKYYVCSFLKKSVNKDIHLSNGILSNNECKQLLGDFDNAFVQLVNRYTASTKSKKQDVNIGQFFEDLVVWIQDRQINYTKYKINVLKKLITKLPFDMKSDMKIFNTALDVFFEAYKSYKKALNKDTQLFSQNTLTLEMKNEFITYMNIKLGSPEPKETHGMFDFEDLVNQSYTILDEMMYDDLSEIHDIFANKLTQLKFPHFPNINFFDLMQHSENSPVFTTLLLECIEHIFFDIKNQVENLKNTYPQLEQKKKTNIIDEKSFISYKYASEIDYLTLNAMTHDQVMAVYNELKQNPQKDNFDWENCKVLISKVIGYFRETCNIRDQPAMCYGYNIFNSSRDQFTNNFSEIEYGDVDLEAKTFFYCLDKQITKRLSGSISFDAEYRGNIIGSEPTSIFIPLPEIKLRYPRKIAQSIDLIVDGDHFVHVSTQCTKGCVYVGKQHKCGDSVNFTQYSILTSQILIHNDLLFFGNLELNNEATYIFTDKKRNKQLLQVVHLLDPIDPCDLQILVDFYKKQKKHSAFQTSILKIGLDILEKCNNP